MNSTVKVVAFPDFASHIKGYSQIAYGPDGEDEKVVTNGGTSESTYYLGGDVGLSSAGTQTKYPHSDARIIGPSTTRFVHRDHINSVRAETDVSGDAALRQRFGAYGQRTVIMSSM